MNRFKFRAWYSGDIEKGEPLLFEQQEIDYELFFVCKEAPEIKYPFYIPFIDSDWIVEEYSGKKDKNGVEIYEGDILQSTYLNEDNEKVTLECLWNKEFVGFEFVDHKRPHIYYCSIEEEFEVIGNIHDKENKK